MQSPDMPLPPKNLRLATLDLNLRKSLKEEKATAKNLLDCARKTELGLRKKIAEITQAFVEAEHQAAVEAS